MFEQLPQCVTIQTNFIDTSLSAACDMANYQNERMNLDEKPLENSQQNTSRMLINSSYYGQKDFPSYSQESSPKFALESSIVELSDRIGNQKAQQEPGGCHINQIGLSLFSHHEEGNKQLKIDDPVLLRISKQAVDITDDFIITDDKQKQQRNSQGSLFDSNNNYGNISSLSPIDNSVSRRSNCSQGYNLTHRKPTIMSKMHRPIGTSHNLERHQMQQQQQQQQQQQHNMQLGCEDSVKYKNHFIILAYVKRFIKSMLLRMSYKNFSLLEAKHFGMIGDAASSMKSIIKTSNKMSSGRIVRGSFQNSSINRGSDWDDLLGFRKHIMNLKVTKGFQAMAIEEAQRIWKFISDCKVFVFVFGEKVFLPDSRAVIAWDFVILITILFHLIVLPVKLCFFFGEHGVTSEQELIVYYLPFIAFTVDIIIGFNTGIFEFGVIVKDRKLISRAFWKQKLLSHIGIISTLFLNYEFDDSIFIEIIAIYIRLNQVTFKFPKISELLNLMALVLFIAHLCGCGFHLVGVLSIKSDGSTDSWILKQNLENESWYYRYTVSIYFAIVTMVTIGYGDVIPINLYERIYAIFMILFSCGIFAYCINAIGNIFVQHNTKFKLFQQKIFDIQEYLECKSINKETQTRVFKYLEYLNEQSDEILTKGQMILAECSEDLREEILKDYYGKILMRLRILQNNFSKEFIATLSTKMKEKRFGPGELIVQQGLQLKNIYFISKGAIEFFVTNGPKKIPICSLQEKYCMIRDQFLLDGRFESTCLSCGQFGHDITSCPQIHHSINLPIFTQRVFYSSPQQRITTATNSFFTPETIAGSPAGMLGITTRLMKQAVIRRNKSNSYAALSNLEDIRFELKFFRWFHAQCRFSEKANINILDEAQVAESDKQFLKRCPKIKGNFWISDEALKEKRAGKKLLNSMYENIEDFVPSSDSEYEDEERESDESEDNDEDEEDDKFYDTQNSSYQFKPNTFKQPTLCFSSFQQIEQPPGVGGTIAFTHTVSGSSIKNSNSKTVSGAAGTASGSSGLGGNSEENAQQRYSSQTSIGVLQKKSTVNHLSLSQSLIEGNDEVLTSPGIPISKGIEKRYSRKQSVNTLMRSGVVGPLFGGGGNISMTSCGSPRIFGAGGGLSDPEFSLGGGGGLFANIPSSNPAETILAKIKLLLGISDEQNPVIAGSPLRKKCLKFDDALGSGGNSSAVGTVDHSVYASQQQQQNSFSNHMRGGLLKQRTGMNVIPTSGGSELKDDRRMHERENDWRRSGKGVKAARRESKASFFGAMASVNTVTEARKSVQIDPWLRSQLLEENQIPRFRENKDEVAVAAVVPAASANKHLFGSLKFSFDKVKEFLLYNPKSNVSNVLKSYKKIWQIKHKSKRIQQGSVSGSPSLAPVGNYKQKSLRLSAYSQQIK